MTHDDSMEISSEHGHNGDDDIDIDIDLATGPNDEDSILDDVDPDTGFDADFEVEPAAETDDPMLDDDDHKSIPMEDIPFEEDYNQHAEAMSFSEPQPPTHHFDDNHNIDTETSFAGDAILESAWEQSIASGEQNGQGITQHEDAEVTKETFLPDDNYEHAQDHEEIAEEMVERHDENLETTEGQVQLTEESLAVDNIDNGDLNPVNEDTFVLEEAGMANDENQTEAHEPVIQHSPQGSPPTKGTSHGNSPHSPTPVGSTSGEEPKFAIETIPAENSPSNHHSPYPEPPFVPGESNDDKNSLAFFGKTDPAKLQEVKACYQNGEYALFSTSEIDDPDDYFLNDLSLADQPLPIFFAAFRAVIENDIPPEGEICVSFAGLGLHVEEESPFLEDVTFGQIVQLHEKLQQHDGVDSPQPLEAFFSFKPSIPRRLAYLKSRAAEGKGLIGMPTMETPLGLQPEDLTEHHDESETFVETYGSDDSLEHSAENTNSEAIEESETNLAAKSIEDYIPTPEIDNIDNINTSSAEHEEARTVDDSKESEAERKTDVDLQPLQKDVDTVGTGYDEDGELIDYEDEEFPKPQKSVEKRSTDNSRTQNAMDEAIRRRSISLAKEELDESVEQAAETSNVTSEETLQEGDIIDYSEDEGSEVGQGEGEPEHNISHQSDGLTSVLGNDEGTLASNGSSEGHGYTESGHALADEVASNVVDAGATHQEGEIIDLLEDDIDLGEDTENPYRIELAVGHDQKDQSSISFNEESVLEDDFEDAAESDSATLNNDSDATGDPQTSYQDTSAGANDEDEIDYEDHEEQDTIGTPKPLVETESPVLNSGPGKRPRAEADFEDVSSTRSNEAKRVRSRGS